MTICLTEAISIHSPLNHEKRLNWIIADILGPFVKTAIQVENSTQVLDNLLINKCKR